jgi:protein arginine N-methyltransferase 1
MNPVVTSMLQSAIAVADRARERVARHHTVRSLVYRARNRSTFANLHQHDIMLADRPRLDAYERALRTHIRPDDVVIDLGTGTGVLAFLAARHAARVHAIEHGPIIEAARAVARDNGIDNVEFHDVHSRDFSLPGGADVILHEQIGGALFNENVVANVCDLRDRVLRPGGRIYPARLELFVEPVQLREDMRAPNAWLQEIHGIRFDALRRYGDTQPFDYWYATFRQFPLERFLCRQEPVVSIDLATASPSDLPTRVTYERPAAADGVLDGFCVYFRAGFGDDVWLTDSPEAPQTSWGAPFLRVECREVAAGDPIRLDLRAADLATPSTWRWR